MMFIQPETYFNNVETYTSPVVKRGDVKHLKELVSKQHAIAVYKSKSRGSPPPSKKIDISPSETKIIRKKMFIHATGMYQFVSDDIK